MAPPTPSKTSLDLEHVRARCKHLQEELEALRRSSSSEREEYHIKISKLEASLNASKKTNMELEVSGCGWCGKWVWLVYKKAVREGESG